MATRRIKVRGIRRREIDTDKLALALWLMAKAEVERSRSRDAADKRARRGGAEDIIDAR